MEYLEQWGQKVAVYRCGALVIGSGCAGLNAADCLYAQGVHDVLLVTEGLNMGTSRNTGSDKQTYYKLAWQSGETDSTDKMAQTLFNGKSVHGDIAFAEAANSVRCFAKLVELGVPFPTNAYGEHVGYRTDHSTEKRATSAGPLTSKYMTQALEKRVMEQKIRIIDHTMVVELIRGESGIIGAIGIDLRQTAEGSTGLCFFLTGNIVLATGGPAAVYRNRVYPPSQTGMTGMAIETGARCVNLQEWQYGIASEGFRWNLSGTYQQAIPRYISVDAQGVQREFLSAYFARPEDVGNSVFQKGYEWPFDAAKLGGSSVIDMLVHHEQSRLGRAVFLDFRTEPEALRNGLTCLSAEAHQYLKNSGALLRTPIARLEKMNPQAIALFAAHGIDLHTQLLPITVAAQHCNGGLAVDADWQTDVPGLYAAGEAAGTFGVYRPGGSALNSTQVGSLRAAQHIALAKRRADALPEELAAHSSVCKRFFSVFSGTGCGCADSIRQMKNELAGQMSRCGAHIRCVPELRQLRSQTAELLEKLDGQRQLLTTAEIPLWFKARDMIITTDAVVRSVLFSAEHIGTRGGSLCCEKIPDCSSVSAIRAAAPQVTRAFDDQVLYYQKDTGCRFGQVRPIPKTETWFETVWNDYNRRRETR